MPTLHWIGKEKVINHHLDVPYRALRTEYAFGDARAARENLIVHGDNLEALKALLPQYEGRVKVVCIDPPYNTGNESWVYNDNVNDPKIRKWLGQTVGREGEDLSRHDKWLCMMYPRLKLLHSLLRDDGVIFTFIDDNEQASMKLMMDEIFGKSNFITTVIWQKVYSPKNTAIHFRKIMIMCLSMQRMPLCGGLIFCRVLRNRIVHIKTRIMIHAVYGNRAIYPLGIFILREHIR